MKVEIIRKVEFSGKPQIGLKSKENLMLQEEQGSKGGVGGEAAGRMDELDRY